MKCQTFSFVAYQKSVSHSMNEDEKRVYIKDFILRDLSITAFLFYL